MKTKFATTALILASALIAGTSFAADKAQTSKNQFGATSLQSWTDGGAIPIAQERVLGVNSTPSTLSREAVKADYLAARKNAALPQTVEGQDYKMGAAPSTLTREKVMADYVAARKAGSLRETNEAS